MSINRFVERLRHVAAELNREKRHVMYIRDRMPRAYAGMLDLTIEALGNHVTALDGIINRMELHDEGAEQKQVAKGLKKLSNDLLAQNEAYHEHRATAGNGNQPATEAEDGTDVRRAASRPGAGAEPSAGDAVVRNGPVPGADQGAPHADPGGGDARLEPGFAQRLPDGEPQ